MKGQKKMGTVIQARRFSPSNQAGLLKPIIYCCQYKWMSEQAIPLNRLLAEKLLAYKPKRRTMQIEKCFVEVVSSLPDECIIKDFDVMFNPDYKIDVLKILTNTCKSKPFSVLWPGRLEGNRLIYAEEGYKDYKAYDINDYDVTCVI